MARKRPPSRPKRWAAAVREAQTQLQLVRDAVESLSEGGELEAEAYTALQDLETALGELVELQMEYQEWRDNMPEGLDSSPLADKLDEVTGIDLEGAHSEAGNMDPEQVDFDSIEEALDEAESADLPLGFGRD